MEAALIQNGQADIDVWNLAVQPEQTPEATERETASEQNSADNHPESDE